MISPRRAVDSTAVATHYDELDEFYRDVWGEHVHHGVWLRGNETREEAVLNLVEIVAREAEGRAPARPVAQRGTNMDVQARVPRTICDIGCGYGATARELAARGAKVIGITISPAQCAFAQQRKTPGTDFVCGDWLTNNLPSAAFDAAIAIESSEHMPDFRGFFAQAERVLRAGGRLVICAWLSADAPSPAVARWLLEPICREGRMPNLATAPEYRSFGEAAGFSLERFEDLSRYAAPTWPAIVRRLLGKLLTRPRYLRFLFNRHARNRIFALTILRIWLAYRTGAMRYGIFTFVKR